MRLVGLLDTETTGVKPETDRIVEIAIVVHDLIDDREVLAFERKINPGMHIPAGAVAIHGITDADVVHAPSFAGVGGIAGSLCNLIGRLDLLAGHNIALFDAPLLVHELVRAKVTVPKFPPIFDTMLEGRGCTEDGRIPNLGDLCWALDIPYDPEQAHGALYDVRVNMQALLRGIKLGYFTLPEVVPLEIAA